jgi:hypothetical protein
MIGHYFTADKRSGYNDNQTSRHIEGREELVLKVTLIYKFGFFSNDSPNI